MQNLNKRLAGLARQSSRMFAPMAIAGRAMQVMAACYSVPSAKGAPLALQVVTTDGDYPEPWGRLTASVPAATALAGDELAVKTYDFDAGMRECLLKTGYFEDTGRRLAAGFAELEVWRMTPRFIGEANKAYPELETA